MEASFEEEGIALPRKGGPLLQAVNFAEPSFVYRFGKDVRLTDQIDLENDATWAVGNLFLIDKIAKEKADYRGFQDIARTREACLKERISVAGLNYSRGDEVDLRVIQVIQCEDTIIPSPTETDNGS